MSKKVENYNIGLDIGTSSIGWTIVDDNAKLIRTKGKQGYGVRIFSEGQTAEERRGFRTTRRRLNRRKWRLSLLREIFEPYILPVDENFFMRQKESNLVTGDANKHFSGSILFNDQTDQDFYCKYPTIYHLRQALMTENRQFDVREIYLAIHHIVKYRGHFLNAAPASSFKGGQLDLEKDFKELNSLFEKVKSEIEFSFNVSNAEGIKKILLDTKKTRSDRQREAIKQIYVASDDKDIEKLRKSVATEFVKAVLGMKTKLFKVLAKQPSSESDWNFSFDSEDIDDKLDSIANEMDDDDLDIIEKIKEIHSIITLTGVVPEGKGLSESMVDKYCQHHKDLKELKALESDLDEKTRNKLKSAYDAYIGQTIKKTTVDDFYSSIKNVLAKVDDPRAKGILNRIDLEEYMPKQRTKANGQIPHQLHQKELDQIIENQKQYYPWLAEINPNDKNRKVASYKLDELVTFRIPYYVGPLVESNQSNQDKEGKFSWMQRKSSGLITPWNFDDKVDRNASAERFIKRMTLKDTYLINEDVLPAQSLTYQRFNVLNELNNVRVNDHRLKSNCKQAVYDDLFRKYATVSIKRFKEYLVTESHCSSDNVKIEGLADESKFISGLTSEIKLRGILGDAVDQKDKFNDLEKIIEWATIFEDNKILRAKLNDIDWLNDGERNELSKLRLRGWGRLSKRLLTGLFDANGDTILDRLWKSSDNFMIIVSDDAFKQAIIKENQKAFKENDSQDLIDEQFTSPQNKKALRQILLVVDDIQRAMGGTKPNKILIEFARGEERNPRRSVQRLNQLRNIYQNISDEILADPEVRKELSDPNNSQLSDRLFLYFLQGGIDLYTGKRLNIERLSEYDIDHILPQAFIKDNSLDNRVLVSSKINRSKSDSVPLDYYTSELFGGDMRPLWEKLARAGLISKKKLANLEFNPENISKYAKLGFINRQLVETRQVIKLAASILHDQYGEDTKIVNVKAGLTHQFREDFDFPKNRDVNNYHHAFDAYLTAFVGTYLLKRYPKLERYFVYGQFKKSDAIPKLGNFNFLHDIKHQDKIVDKETGELILDKVEQLEYMNKIYDFKKVTVVHETRERHGAMYDQTLYKASDDKASGQGKKQLIRKKDNMPTELYGGYTGSTDAFMAIIRLKKKDEFYYKVIGVPTRVANSVEDDVGNVDPIKLRDYIAEKLTKTKVNKKTGEITKITDWFELILSKVRYAQAVFDGGQPFMLGSSTYPYNLRELYLPKEAIKFANGDRKAKMSADEVFKYVLDSVNKYFPLYDSRDTRKKLNESVPIYLGLSESKDDQNSKKQVLNKIFIGLHSNASFSDLKILKISSPFGFMQKGAGISLSSKSKIIFQSPTGLFERCVELNNMKPLA